MKSLLSKIEGFLAALTVKQAILTIIIVGFLTFGRALSGGFIGDDTEQVVANPLVRSISNVPTMFRQGTFIEYDGTRERNNYYKPILATTFAGIYFFSGSNPFGFHLAQISLHIANAVLVFSIFRHFFRKETSLIFSLLFLVHPINTESVAYISALQENLFLFFGLIALNLTLKKPGSWYTNLFVPFLLLASLLSKETGIVFIGIIPWFSLLYQRRQFVITSSQAALGLSIYLFLRLEMAHISLVSQVIKVAPIQTLDLGQRLINVPKIIFFYLKTFFYPKDLIVFQSWTVQSLSFEEFYLPVTLVTAFLLSLLLMGSVMYKKKSAFFKSFLFFVIWFLAGLTLHLQIIPLDQTVADRWFYFPIVGLLGMISASTEYVISRKRQISGFIPALAVIIIILLAGRTIIRAENWNNPIALVTHDANSSQNSFQIEEELGTIAQFQGDTREAESHYLRATQIFPGQRTFGILGDFYLKNERPDQAVNAYNQMLDYNKNSAMEWAFLAIAQYKAGDKSGAIISAKRAYSISPTNTFFVLLETIENGRPITIQ